MSIYTVSNDEFQVIHQRLSDLFDSAVAEVDFGETTIQTVPRNSAPVRLPGELNPFYGRTHSEEFVDKQKQRRKDVSYEQLYGDRSAEIRKKQSEAKLGDKNSFYGKKHSAEAVSKIKEAAKNRSADYYNKIGAILASQPKLTCPHCGKVADARNSKRWHFDNCKFKSTNE